MTKRIVSLLMAVMLVIGIFAVPAMAAQENEGIEPCVLASRCGYCNEAIYETDAETWAQNGYVSVEDCYKTHEEHDHFRSWKVTGIRCRSCGQYTITKRVLMTDSCTFVKV